MFIQLLLYDGYLWVFSHHGGWYLIVSTAKGGGCQSLHCSVEEQSSEGWDIFCQRHHESKSWWYNSSLHSSLCSELLKSGLNCILGHLNCGCEKPTLPHYMRYTIMYTMDLKGQNSWTMWGQNGFQNVRVFDYLHSITSCMEGNFLEGTVVWWHHSPEDWWWWTIWLLFPYFNVDI